MHCEWSGGGSIGRAEGARGERRQLGQSGKGEDGEWLCRHCKGFGLS